MLRSFQAGKRELSLATVLRFDGINMPLLHELQGFGRGLMLGGDSVCLLPRMFMAKTCPIFMPMTCTAAQNRNIGAVLIVGYLFWFTLLSLATRRGNRNRHCSHHSSDSAAKSQKASVVATGAARPGW